MISGGGGGDVKTWGGIREGIVIVYVWCTLLYSGGSTPGALCAQFEPPLCTARFELLSIQNYCITNEGCCVGEKSLEEEEEEEEGLASSPIIVLIASYTAE